MAHVPASGDPNHKEKEEEKEVTPASQTTPKARAKSKQA